MLCYSLAPTNFSLAERATMVYIEIKKQLSRDQAWVIWPASQAPSLLSCTICSLKTSCVTLVTKTRGCLSLVPLTKLNQIMKKQVYPYKNDWETPTPPPTNWQSSREQVPFLWGGYTEDCTIETGVVDGTLSSPPVYHGSYLSRGQVDSSLWWKADL